MFRLLKGVSPPTVGDLWLDGPGCDETKGAWKIMVVEPPQNLVLYSMRDPATGRELNAARNPKLFIDSSWAFHLEQSGPGRTRLVARTRIQMKPRWALLTFKWIGGGDTVMQRRLLEGIKIRVEGALAARHLGARTS